LDSSDCSNPLLSCWSVHLPQNFPLPHVQHNFILFVNHRIDCAQQSLFSSLISLSKPSNILSRFICMCVTIDGVWIVNGFNDHLYTQLGISINYSAIANLHTL
jgi:hypothetical protein